ncbi:cytochrome c family protein [Candidatus Walczuchella monophlebidarum]|uniref:Cytochrome c family protein n=2 Tax=Candidatus Walczuchella monophlebidarum TaxID=1415657 RepID=A0A068DS69_9FLAO|nr:cytochrome c family protein [Candidatus Walczuchella monophlebidarum]
MPDMYYSKAYEAYSDTIHQSIFKNGTTSLSTVAGTVPRTDGNMFPYPFPNSKKGYHDSKKIKVSPLNQRKENLARGEKMYQINCSICHGNTGDGQGELVKKEKILGVPNYKNLEITVGSVYHVIMYGKNNMGSYASQLTPLDRWKVAEYVIKLKQQ